MMAMAMHDPKPLRRLSFFDKKVGILAGSPPIRDTQPLHGKKKIAGLTVDTLLITGTGRNGIRARAVILKSETYHFHRLDLTRQPASLSSYMTKTG
jgi:hypothetical protein